MREREREIEAQRAREGERDSQREKPAEKGPLKFLKSLKISVFLSLKTFKKPYFCSVFPFLKTLKIFGVVLQEHPKPYKQRHFSEFLKFSS